MPVIKNLLIFFMFVIISSVANAQYPIVKDVSHFSQGFPLNGLTGNGYNSTVIANVNNLSNSNPALINNFDKPALGLSYLFSSKIDDGYFVNIDYEKTKNEIPNSFGLVFPVTQSFNLAVGMNQSYNKSYELEVTITTEENPDGDPTIPKIHIYEKTLIYGFDLSAAYSIENIFSETDNFSIGSNISFNYLYNNADNLDYSTQFSEPEIGWKIGAIYKNQYEKNKFYCFGIYYERAFSFFDYVKAKPLIIDDGEIKRDSTIRIISSFYYDLKSKLPNKLSIGFGIKPFGNFIFNGEIKEIFFSDTHPNLEDQIEFVLNASYLLSDNFKITGGIFYTGRSYKDDIFNVNDETNGLFLLCGLISKFDFISLDLSAADGHLFSGTWRKQTVFRIGTDVSF